MEKLVPFFKIWDSYFQQTIDTFLERIMYPSIATTVLPRIEESIWFKFVLAFAGSVLLAVSAKVQIPFLLSESLKIMLAVLVMPLIWKRLSD